MAALTDSNAKSSGFVGSHTVIRLLEQLQPTLVVCEQVSFSFSNRGIAETYRVIGRVEAWCELRNVPLTMQLPFVRIPNQKGTGHAADARAHLDRYISTHPVAAGTTHE